jgi:hypothetical protein
MLLITGCGSLGRYQDAQTKYTLTSPRDIQIATILFLEPIFPGKLFSEMVCDNAIGAIWSPEESKKIGFTQNYSETFSKHSSQLALLTLLPANLGAGLAASGQGGSFNISSRIMVPYGRFITNNLTELLAASSPNSRVCLDQQCVQSNLERNEKVQVINIQFSKLRVAEDKKNTLTLVVEGTTTMIKNGQAVRSSFSHSIVERSITSEGFFHSDVLLAMNKMANEISSAVVQQIYSIAIH